MKSALILLENPGIHFNGREIFESRLLSPILMAAPMVFQDRLWSDKFGTNGAKVA